VADFPTEFNSVDQIENYLTSLTYEEFKEFINRSFDFKGTLNGEKHTQTCEIPKNLANAIEISNKNDDGIEIVDKTTDVRIMIDYKDLVKIFLDTYPLCLALD
jgi:hypothetical protein